MTNNTSTELDLELAERAEDEAFHADLTATVATLPVPTEAQVRDYNAKMTVLAGIEAEIRVKNPKFRPIVDATVTETDACPKGKYLEMVYTLGTL